MQLYRLLSNGFPGRLHALAVLPAGLGGCSMPVIDLEPAGPVARSIDQLFWLATDLMALVLLVVFALLAWVLLNYRMRLNSPVVAEEGAENWLEWLIWGFPAIIITVLGYLCWDYTHRLDPSLPLESSGKPLEIQVIALDWKWLFIYPEQNVASVNQVALPVGRPVCFRITSGTVMNSFFIPRLAGQIYAMGGMETTMHLLADRPGRYMGENSQYNGRGFSFQNFTALALTEQDFGHWIDQARQSAQNLDSQRYQMLAEPSIKHRPEFFGGVGAGFFDWVVQSTAHGQTVVQ